MIAETHKARNGFFDCPQARERLAHHALKWVGTPFVPHAAILGAGVDCVNLCAQIYMACGFIEGFTPPTYSMDGGKHNAESQLTAWLDRDGRFWKLEAEARGDARPTNYQPGDLLCFTTGRSAHHTGIVVHDVHFVHCLFSRRVIVSTLADKTFRRRLTAVYRPILKEAA